VGRKKKFLPTFKTMVPARGFEGGEKIILPTKPGTTVLKMGAKTKLLKYLRE